MVKEKAYEKIQPGEYYPCLSINYGKNVMILNSSAKMPSKPYTVSESNQEEE